MVNPAMLKRRQGTPPEAPAPAKRPNTRSRSPIPVNANGQPLEVIPGKGETLSKVPTVTKQKIGQTHPSVTAVVQAEQAVNNPDREVEAARTPETSVQLENISHGQLILPEVSEPSTDTGSSTLPPKPPPPAPQPKQQKHQPHIVPTHAGWFTWTGIHPLEKRGLPEFFNGKTKMNTPELYMEYRNFLIQKYRENPDKVLTITDIQDLVVGDLNAVRRIIEFLDHWGLINYHAVTRPGQSHPAWLGTPPKVEENSAGELHAVPHSVTPLQSLYQFETPTKSTANSSSLDPVASLAETFVSDARALTPGPSVEYHCNACSADCSKRRYHCQKQADFDLCPDCYNDGKFGPGMSLADFIRMDAHSDANSDDGGWTDQETLLLLEALELFGDNWNEIAEHVATKSKAQCILHFIKMPIEDSFFEDAENPGSATAAGPPSNAGQTEDGPVTPKSKPVGPAVKNGDENGKVTQKEDTVFKAITDASASMAVDRSSDGLISFADAGNPVMAQVAFLAAMVGPRVAATAAQSALMALSEDDPAAQLAAKATFVLDDPTSVPLPPSLDRINGSAKDEDPKRKEDSKDMDNGDQAENDKDTKPELKDGRNISAERVRNAAATALAAAAVKAKLLADQEEREMQRLVINVIETQLKKLETKLKQFGELEVMLKKEYEQIERSRQRHFAERARLLQSRMAPGGLVATGPPTEALGGQQLQQHLQQQQQVLQQQQALQQQQQHQQQQQQQQQPQQQQPQHQQFIPFVGGPSKPPAEDPYAHYNRGIVNPYVQRPGAAKPENITTPADPYAEYQRKFMANNPSLNYADVASAAEAAAESADHAAAAARAAANLAHKQLSRESSMVDGDKVPKPVRKSSAVNMEDRVASYLKPHADETDSSEWDSPMPKEQIHPLNPSRNLSAEQKRAERDEMTRRSTGSVTMASERVPGQNVEKRLSLGAARANQDEYNALFNREASRAKQEYYKGLFSSTVREEASPRAGKPVFDEEVFKPSANADVLAKSSGRPVYDEDYDTRPSRKWDYGNRKELHEEKLPVFDDPPTVEDTVPTTSATFGKVDSFTVHLESMDENILSKTDKLFEKEDSDASPVTTRRKSTKFGGAVMQRRMEKEESSSDEEELSLNVRKPSTSEGPPRFDVEVKLPSPRTEPAEHDNKTEDYVERTSWTGSSRPPARPPPSLMNVNTNGKPLNFQTRFHGSGVDYTETSSLKKPYRFGGASVRTKKS